MSFEEASLRALDALVRLRDVADGFLGEGSLLGDYVVVAAFLVPLALCAWGRRWLAAAGVLLWGAATLAALPLDATAKAARYLEPSGLPDSVPTPVLAIVAIGGAVLIGWDARRAGRRLGTLDARVGARSAEVAALRAELDRERFWRQAMGHSRDPIASDELLELARRVQEPILVARASARPDAGGETDNDAPRVEAPRR